MWIDAEVGGGGFDVVRFGEDALGVGVLGSGGDGFGINEADGGGPGLGRVGAEETFAVAPGAAGVFAKGEVAVVGGEFHARRAL